MFKNLLNKYRVLHNEKETEKRVKGARKGDTINRQKLEDAGVIVGKQNSEFCGSAIKIILDNMATASDIENVLQTDAELRKGYITSMKECEFCDGKCENGRICCSKKEMEIFLANEAVDKLNSILYTARTHKKKKQQKSGLNKRPVLRETPSSDSIGALVKKETFKKLKNKMYNLKKYYPSIYSHPGNVIEQWGTGEMEKTISMDILQIDPKSTSIFWV